MLQVYNKIDRMEEVEPHIDRDDTGRPVRVWLSAQSGEGVDLLMQALKERLATDMYHQYIDLEPGEGQLRAQLYAKSAVLSEEVSEDGRMRLEIRIQQKDFKQLLSRLNIPASRYVKEPEKEEWV